MLLMVQIISKMYKVQEKTSFEEKDIKPVVNLNNKLVGSFRASSSKFYLNFIQK